MSDPKDPKDKPEEYSCSLEELANIFAREDTRQPIPFKEYLDKVKAEPQRMLRNVFQRFHDMMHYFVAEPEEEDPNDPENIGFLPYDCTRLFTENVQNPFFADRLFSNRLMDFGKNITQSGKQDRIYLFIGPHGSGKSTFINNLVQKFQEYSNTSEGAVYEMLWRLNIEKLGGFDESAEWKHGGNTTAQKTLEVPCPNHDNPILMIPKHSRKQYLDRLITDEQFKKRMFSEKEFEWLFKREPCTICSSLYTTLAEKEGISVEDIFDMMAARRYKVDRTVGQGVSIYNPGDKINEDPILNKALHERLSNLLRDSSKVALLSSRHAMTNDGIYVIMDVKENNVHRLMNLHGIASEGVHKVDCIEEAVSSLFLGVMNHEDLENKRYKKSLSMQDRVEFNQIPYVLDYNTEVEIYKEKFGKKIVNAFLPGVIENFAKLIISTRMEPDSPAMKNWIKERGKYAKYCDKGLLLLRMDIYTGEIPAWLSEEDRNKFTSNIRMDIINGSAQEGREGFSGRDSLDMMVKFMQKYAKEDRLITMDNVAEFFDENYCNLEKKNFVESKFVDDVTRAYDHKVTEQVKECLYKYNDAEIRKEIRNYIYFSNFDPPAEQTCPFTGDTVKLSESYFDHMENIFLGGATSAQREAFRKRTQVEYVTKTMNQMRAGIGLDLTPPFMDIYSRYIKNIKSNVLQPVIGNRNFRQAVHEYTPEKTGRFRTFDRRIQNDVEHVITQLQQKYDYTLDGAKEVMIYVLDLTEP